LFLSSGTSCLLLGKHLSLLLTNDHVLVRLGPGSAGFLTADRYRGDIEFDEGGKSPEQPLFNELSEDDGHLSGLWLNLVLKFARHIKQDFLEFKEDYLSALYVHQILRLRILQPHWVKQGLFSLQLLLDLIFRRQLLDLSISFLAETFSLFNLGVVGDHLGNLLIDIEHGSVVFAVLLEGRVT
jgi:hypothetical protein